MARNIQVKGGLEGSRKVVALGQLLKVGLLLTVVAFLVGYRQACLDADMDDYVAKPIDLDRLGNVLDRWVPQSAGTPSQQDQDEVGQQSA